MIKKSSKKISKMDNNSRIQPKSTVRYKSELTLAIYIFVAFAFSFLARMYWYYYASAEPSYIFNNQVMINTNDGYYYAEGARDLISGHHEFGDRSGVEEPVAILTALLSKAMPFVSFESLILFMPAFFGSLIVVPMVLLGRSLDRPFVGFLAALIASVTYSYYNRTMLGYYDSDMLALPLPIFSLYFLIELIKKRSLQNMLGSALFFSLTIWGYQQSFTLMLGMVGLGITYSLIFHRRERDLFLALFVLLVAISRLNIEFKALILASTLLALYFKRELFERFFWIVLIGFAAIFVYFGGFDITVNSYKAYILKDSQEVKSAFRFFDVVQTVREAGHINFDIFSQRISGSVVAFFLSFAGLLLLYKDKKIFILSLPLLGLGFLAMKAGLRFTVYAVPVMAFGYSYLAVYLSEKLSNPMRALVVAFFVLFSMLQI